ncbi:MAG: sigma-70 family RNA polymerase sigma factor [Bacteroidales bacterium]|jgi:RNA polymerase sigma-70 factor (ECF subfamily)|nr:sigma-70 family RNA polymerase sigma factor [Bacteroidales bacterium]
MEKDEIRELIIHSKQGNTKAFGELVVLFQPLVFQLSFRLLCDNDEAKDMVQEVFIKLWLQLEKYNPRYKFSTWVYKITCNMCYDRLRFIQRYPKSIEISSFIAEYVAVSSHNVETSVINSELKELILYFTNGLSPKQKIVFTLNDIEGLETEEIKEITGLSAGQIKSNLHLARKYIKDRINAITS